MSQATPRHMSRSVCHHHHPLHYRQQRPSDESFEDEDGDVLDLLAVTDGDTKEDQDTIYSYLEPPHQLRLEDLDAPDPMPVGTYFANTGFWLAEDDEEDLEYYVQPSLAHWCLPCHRALEDDEVLVFNISKSKVSAVIRRELNNLTPEEIRNHAAEVEQQNSKNSSGGTH